MEIDGPGEEEGKPGGCSPLSPRWLRPPSLRRKPPPGPYNRRRRRDELAACSRSLDGPEKIAALLDPDTDNVIFTDVGVI
jgi:hypothetical protein